MTVDVVELNCDNETLALAEVSALGEIRDRARGVAVAEGLAHHRLGMAHRVLEHLGSTVPPDGDGDRAEGRRDDAAAADAALALVEAAVEDGRIAPRGSFRVRVRGIGGTAPSVERLERDAGAAIHAAGGSVDLDDPDDEYRLVHTDGRWFLGRLRHETEGFGARPPTDNPFFKPGAMGPARARALVDVAGGHTGASLLDPMCGTGGFLAESALVGGHPVGCDVQREMVAGARDNLAWLADAGSPRGRAGSGPGDGDRDPGAGVTATDPAAAALAVADARGLPFRDASLDRAVTDLPYGRASRVEADTVDALARAALEELRRVVRGRVVAVADERLHDAAADAGYRVADVIEDRVHRSLTRRIHVLEPD